MTRGYDNLPMLMQTILDLPFYERTGGFTHDIARPPLTALDHTAALAGVTITWTYWGLSNTTIIGFTAASSDRLTIPALESTDLNFMVNAFSGVVWVYPLLLAGNLRYIFCKGGVNSGWGFWINGGNGSFELATYQAGPADQETISAVGLVVLNTWSMLGFTRLAGSVKLYLNGVELTPATAEVHTNPDTAAAEEFHIGVTTAHAAPFEGYLWRPIIFSRNISAIEMAQLFEMTRGLFGV